MTTPTAEGLVIDTSVLLEASDSARRQHTQARRLIETRAALVFPAQVAREFLVVATRPPTANGLGLTLNQALESLDGFRDRIALLPEERPLLPVLLRLLVDSPATSKRIHDAHIVAAAVAHRIRRIVTLNIVDFAAFSQQVEVLTPAAVMAQSRQRRTAR